MDDRGFDALTRRIFALTSRRAVAVSVAGTLAVLTGWLTGRSTSAQRRPKSCRPLGHHCFPGHGVSCCGKVACRRGKCRCKRGQRACRGRCISKQRCCRNRDCGRGQTCRRGRCRQCRPGQHRCGKQCLPKNVCCPGQTRCNGGCANLNTSPNNCGECGFACAGAATCQNGICVGGSAYREVRRWGAGELDDPQGITVDAAGMVYVVDRDHKSVGVFTATGGIVTTWPAGSDPFGIEISPGGILYVSQPDANEIQTYAGTGDRQSLTISTGDSPAGLAISPSGEIYVAIRAQSSVQTFLLDGTPIADWLDFGAPIWTATAPTSDIYVTDQGTQSVIWLSSVGDVKGEWGTAGTGNGDFDDPIGITVDAAGFVYVVDSGNQRVQKFTASGDLVGVIADATTLAAPVDIAVSRSGMVYVTDPGNLPGGQVVVQFAPA